jgi:hypothetical protein
LQSESLWELGPEPCCTIADAEEYKVLGIFVEGNGIRCHDKSQDHWSTCFALCVATEQLVRTSVTVVPLALGAESRCQAGQHLLGGGFAHCPTMDCSARLDMLQARPHASDDAFLCAARVLPKETVEDPASGVLRTPQCQAICAEISE